MIKLVESKIRKKMKELRRASYYKEKEDESSKVSLLTSIREKKTMSV